MRVCANRAAGGLNALLAARWSAGLKVSAIRWDESRFVGQLVGLFVGRTHKVSTIEEVNEAAAFFAAKRQLTRLL